MRQLVLFNCCFTRHYKHIFSPGIAGCASTAPAVPCPKPINTLTPPAPDFVSADASALNRYTPLARANSIRLPVNSSSVVPPVLRNVMMLPLSHFWPTDVLDLCKPVSLGAIRKSPATLIASRVRKQNVVLPVVVNRCPVADLASAPSPLGFPPRLLGQAVLTHGCRSSTIDQEITVTWFTYRHRVQPLCKGQLAQPHPHRPVPTSH